MKSTRPGQKIEVNLNTAISTSLELCDQLKTMIEEPFQNIIHLRAFIRTFCHLAESCTFIRDQGKNPKFAEILALKDLNLKGLTPAQLTFKGHPPANDNLITNFTGARNYLLHNFVWNNALGWDKRLDVIITLVSGNIEQFENALNRILNPQTSLKNSSPMEISSLPDSKSENVERRSVSQTATMIKTIKSTPKDKTGYGLLDYIFFANHEINMMEIILSQYNLNLRNDKNIGDFGNTLTSFFNSDRFQSLDIKDIYVLALQNCIENICICFDNINKQFNIELGKDTIKKNIQNKELLHAPSLSELSKTILFQPKNNRIDIAHAIRSAAVSKEFIDIIGAIEEIKIKYLINAEKRLCDLGFKYDQNISTLISTQQNSRLAEEKSYNPTNFSTPSSSSNSLSSSSAGLPSPFDRVATAVPSSNPKNISHNMMEDVESKSQNQDQDSSMSSVAAKIPRSESPNIKLGDSRDAGLDIIVDHMRSQLKNVLFNIDYLNEKGADSDELNAIREQTVESISNLTKCEDFRPKREDLYKARDLLTKANEIVDNLLSKDAEISVSPKPK